MRGDKKVILAALVLAALTAGCTGTKLQVRPDPEGMQGKYDGACGSVAVRETAPDRVYPPAGNLVPGFADALRESGLAKQVYYPARPDDKVDHTMEAKFDVTFEPNMGSNMVKSFVTGLTLFLLEPAFWYDYDYSLKGEVGVYRGTLKTDAVRAETDASFQMKFLSLGQAVNLEGETLTKAKKSLYQQLLKELGRTCSTP
jgi:hypothetical protein